MQGHTGRGANIGGRKRGCSARLSRVVGVCKAGKVLVDRLGQQAVRLVMRDVQLAVPCRPLVGVNRGAPCSLGAAP